MAGHTDKHILAMLKIILLGDIHESNDRSYPVSLFIINWRGIDREMSNCAITEQVGDTFLLHHFTMKQGTRERVFFWSIGSAIGVNSFVLTVCSIVVTL